MGTEGLSSAATRGSSSAGAAAAEDAKSLVRTSGLAWRPDLRRKARDCRTAAGAEERSRRWRQCCSAARAADGGWHQAGAVGKRRQHLAECMAARRGAVRF